MTFGRASRNLSCLPWLMCSRSAMVSSLAFLLSLLGYLVSSLLGANIVDLNDAAIAPAERPASAPALCTPEPLQRQRSMAEVLMGGRGSSSKKTKQHTARAAVANLKSASMTPGSKKRKHQYSIEEVGSSDNSAGVRQQQRDANEIVDSMFIKTKDNPDRIKATLKRVVEHAASHPRTEAEVGHEGLRILLGSKDRWSTEEEEEAGRCRCGRQAADQLSQLLSLLSSGICPPLAALWPLASRFALALLIGSWLMGSPPERDRRSTWVVQ